VDPGTTVYVEFPTPTPNLEENEPTPAPEE
jgi:hypothetical protein